jgi:hypothetical protein
MIKDYQNREGEYEKSYGGSSYNKDERSHFAGRKEETTPRKDAGSVSEETPDQQTEQKVKRAKTIYKKLFLAWLFLFLLSNVFSWIWNDDSSDEDVQSEETMDDPWGWDDMDDEEEALSVADSVAAMDVSEEKDETIQKENDGDVVDDDGNVSDDDLSTP